MLEENETVEETEILGVEGLNWSRQVHCGRVSLVRGNTTTDTFCKDFSIEVVVNSRTKSVQFDTEESCIFQVEGISVNLVQ